MSLYGSATMVGGDPPGLAEPLQLQASETDSLARGAAPVGAAGTPRGVQMQRTRRHRLAFNTTAITGWMKKPALVLFAAGRTAALRVRSGK